MGSLSPAVIPTHPDLACKASSQTPTPTPSLIPRQPNLNLWSQGCHEVLLGHLQGLASTLGNMLAVTFLLQVSQQRV